MMYVSACASVWGRVGVFVCLHQVDNFDHSDRMMATATACMIGIIHYNGFAGRSGEWQRLKAEHVQEQLDKKLSFLVCKDFLHAASPLLTNMYLCLRVTIRRHSKSTKQHNRIRCEVECCFVQDSIQCPFRPIFKDCSI